jgi:hypothetical protein
MGHYHYNCDEYCEDCLPVHEDHEEVDYDCGEQDTPANCCVCHKPLEYSLTSDGVKYVLESIRESLNKSEEDRNKVHNCYDNTWYENCRHVEIVRDWANNLKWYGGLSEEEEELIDHFLEVTEE